MNCFIICDSVLIYWQNRFCFFALGVATFFAVKPLETFQLEAALSEAVEWLVWSYLSFPCCVLLSCPGDRSDLTTPSQRQQYISLQ